mmetsp:Transcript_26543/g.55771  ORF Transcript_26543/g.55771 Transcript_26543/m.55771 type:complete len:306 (-) Transcript_26543:500-1417(-)
MCARRVRARHGLETGLWLRGQLATQPEFLLGEQLRRIAQEPIRHCEEERRSKALQPQLLEARALLDASHLHAASGLVSAGARLQLHVELPQRGTGSASRRAQRALEQLTAAPVARDAQRLRRRFCRSSRRRCRRLVARGCARLEFEADRREPRLRALWVRGAHSGEQPPRVEARVHRAARRHQRLQEGRIGWKVAERVGERVSHESRRRRVRRRVLAEQPHPLAQQVFVRTRAQLKGFYCMEPFVKNRLSCFEAIAQVLQEHARAREHNLPWEVILALCFSLLESTCGAQNVHRRRRAVDVLHKN